MIFRCNNSEWTIEEVDEATINNEMKNDYTLGVTIYKTQKILLLKDQANIIKTLKHELIHVWLYEYGHPQNDGESYTYENICEIVACSNDFVNEVIKDYLGIEALYLCDKEKNTECDKKNCDVCMMTNNIKFAKKAEEVCYVENKEWDSLLKEEKEAILKKIKEQPTIYIENEYFDKP